MSTKRKFKDDEYKIIHVDVEKIRARPTQFVSSLGESGVFHLCKEVIDNASDEALKSESPCDEIRVDMTDKFIKVSDNGRGIPTDIMQEVYETMQAGTNMTRAGGTTRGENGLGGSTCLLALSSYLKVVSTRPYEKKRLTLEYREACLVNRVLEEYTGNDHGLEVTYSPSHKVLGTSEIPVDRIVEWLSDFDYTLKRGIRFVYNVNGKEYEVRNKELNEYINSNIPVDERLCNDLSFSCGDKLNEIFMEKSYNRHFNVDVVISYSDPEKYKGEDIRHSWMNMIYTPQNGDHVDGVIRGFSRYIREKVVSKNKKLEGVNIKRDIETHMSIVVRAECDFAHMFSSQAKHTVECKELGKAIEKATYDALNRMNNSVINEIVDVVIGNHRARIEGEKARNISSTTKALKTWQKPDSYYPCSSVKTEEPKELFLVEGNSAGGGLKGARNTKYQAILTFRGKSLNIWDLTLDRALASVPWLNLVKVLGCGIGPTFDIKKLNFDKIIIATDADIDGYHIRTGISAFFVKFLPEIVNAGKLYIAEPPLYKLVKNKEVFYVASQTEYLHKCIDSIDDMEIEFPEMK